MRRLAPVFGLFLLAPFTGEFLLGNLSGADIAIGLLLVPLYGCGAILVRELGRRTGGGWPAIGLLAVAYALLEEGPLDQLLWNDSYAGHDYLSGPSYLPALGMSVELTQTIIALHAIWSISVPIAIVESFVPGRATVPWLGRFGLTVTSIIFALGAAFVFWGNYSEEHFMASPGQLAGVGAVIVLLVVLAFRVHRLKLPPVAGAAPSPWVAGALGLVFTSAYWGPAVLVTASWYEWIGVGAWILLAAAGLLLISRWSRQEGWSQRHVFALAAGAMCTYIWLSFPVRPELGGSLTVDLVSNAVCALIAAAVLISGGIRSGKRDGE
jgi:hypothetical protein